MADERRDIIERVLALVLADYNYLSWGKFDGEEDQWWIKEGHTLKFKIDGNYNYHDGRRFARVIVVEDSQGNNVIFCQHDRFSEMYFEQRVRFILKDFQRTIDPAIEENYQSGYYDARRFGLRVRSQLWKTIVYAKRWVLDDQESPVSRLYLHYERKKPQDDSVAIYLRMTPFYPMKRNLHNQDQFTFMEMRIFKFYKPMSEWEIFIFRFGENAVEDEYLSFSAKAEDEADLLAQFLHSYALQSLENMRNFLEPTRNRGNRPNIDFDSSIQNFKSTMTKIDITATSNVKAWMALDRLATLLLDMREPKNSGPTPLLEPLLQ